MAEHSDPPSTSPPPPAVTAVAAAAPGAGAAASDPLGLPHPRLARLPATRCVLDGVVPRELARELLFVYRVRREGAPSCVGGRGGRARFRALHRGAVGETLSTLRPEGCAGRLLHNTGLGRCRQQAQPPRHARRVPQPKQPCTPAHPGTMFYHHTHEHRYDLELEVLVPHPQACSTVGYRPHVCSATIHDVAHTAPWLLPPLVSVDC